MTTRLFYRVFTGGLNSLIPYTIHGGEGVKVVADILKHDQIPTIYGIIRRVIDGGASAVSSTEFGTEDRFSRFLTASTAAFSLKEDKTGQFIGFFNIMPQGFCRSVLPICNRGYIILDPSFRGKNVSSEIFRLFTACNLASGCLSGLGHAPQKYGHVALSSAMIGLYTSCVIPDGVKLQQTGWWDDQLTYVDFVKQFPDLPNSKLSEEEVIKRAISSTWIRSLDIHPRDNQMHFSITTNGGQSACVRPGREDEFADLYDMLSCAAKTADGFGVDEFPSLNTFLENYLVGRCLHAIEDEQRKSLIGAIVVGRSHLTRGNPDLAMMQIYLHPDYRRLGYGTLIERAVAKQLKKIGYTGVLTDLLMTKRNIYRLATKAGYVNIGSVPKSAYVTKQGWTDATVLLKKFDEPMAESWLRDFSQNLINIG